jgi:hypothetical protein
MKSKSLPLFFASVLAAASSVLAQSTKSDADAAWNSVKNVADASSVAPASVASMIDSADQLRDFYTKYPTSGQARNAKALEGLALTRAWLAGDESQATRREQVVADSRRDKSVDTPLRAELFALADSVVIAKTPGLSQAGRLLAYEQATRGVMAEFPGLPNGYESLLRIAHDSGEMRASVLAQELSGLGAAPAWVRTESQVILNRFALVGQSLLKVTAVVANSGDPISKTSGRPVLIYSWAKSSTSSQLRAKAFAAGAGGTMILGVCLDGDEESARAQASTAGLPGDQIYEPQGARGAVAGKLFFTEPGLIYRADAAGIIQSVSAQNEPPPSSAAGLDVASNNDVPLKMDPTKPAYPGFLTSADPSQPPPFADGPASGPQSAEAVVPSAGVTPALRVKIDAAYGTWLRTKGIAAFKPGLFYAGTRAFLTLETVARELPSVQGQRRKAIVTACGFLLADDAFERVSLTVSFVDAREPGIVPGQTVEFPRAAFQAAVGRAGASANFTTAFAAVARDDRALAQVCTELSVP